MNEGKVILSAALESDSQAAEGVEPRQRALDYPAVAA
jgi:hypothetical protein